MLQGVRYNGCITTIGDEMKTEYEWDLEGLEKKNARTREVIEARKAKIASLRKIIEDYTKAIESHEEFVTSREKKLADEDMILAEMNRMLPRLITEYELEINSPKELVYEKNRTFSYAGLSDEDAKKLRAEEAKYLPDTVGTLVSTYKRDMFLEGLWKDKINEFNLVNLGRKKNGS